MTKEKWEDIASPHTNDYLERIKVPGGWLYRCRIYSEDDNYFTLTMTFVPIPEGDVK